MTRLTATLSNHVQGTPKAAVLVIGAPPVKDTVGDVIYSGGGTIPFREGKIDVELLPTDTPNTDPAVWNYTFTVKWEGGQLPPFSAPVTGSLVDLTALQPMDPAEPDYLPSTFPLSRVEGLDEYVDAAVEDAAAVTLPGTELAYAQSTTAHSSTNIYDTNGTALIPGLSVSVVGTGRPVEVEFFAAGLWNSTLYADTLPFVVINGNPLAGVSVGTWSLFTTQGPSAVLKRRLVLTEGQTYTIAAGIMCAAGGGTANIQGNEYGANYLSVVSR